MNDLPSGCAKLTLGEVGDVFRNVRAHLKKDGYFLFDVNTPKLYEDKQHGTIHRSINGYEFDQVLLYDAEKRISKTRFEFDDGSHEEHVQRPYTHDEMEMKIHDSGLRLIRSFDNNELRPPESNSYKIYFLAQRS